VNVISHNALTYLTGSLQTRQVDQINVGTNRPPSYRQKHQMRSPRLVQTDGSPGFQTRTRLERCQAMFALLRIAIGQSVEAVAKQPVNPALV
jgi:hypothetical protein